MTLSQKFYAAKSLNYLISWLALDYIYRYLPSHPISGVSWECVKAKTRAQLNSRRRDPSRSSTHIPTQQNYQQLIGDMAQWIQDCEIDCGFQSQQWLTMLAYAMTEHSLSQRRPENSRTTDGAGLIQWIAEHPIESKQFRSQPSYSGPMLPSWYDVLHPVAPENLTPWDLSYLLMVPNPEDNYWSESEKEFIVKDSIVMVIEAIWSASLAWVRRDPLLFESNCFETETHWADIAERLSQINNKAKSSVD